MNSMAPVSRAALLLGIVLVAASTARAAGTERSFERRFPVTGAIALDADTHSGAVDVRTGADGTVTIRGTVKRNVSWRGAQVSDAEIARLRDAPPVRADAGTIRIEPIPDESLRRSVSIDYEILVPAAARVSITTRSGGVSVAGSRESVRVVTGSGAVRIHAAAGSVDLRSGSGSLRVAGTMDSLAMQTQSGSILAETDAVGAVETSSGSGSVTVSGIRGRLRAETGSGQISLDGAPTGDWAVRSRSGSVTLRVPADSGFDLVAKSRSGSVKSALSVAGPVAPTKHVLEGAVNGGGPKVEVETGSSSITLRP